MAIIDLFVFAAGFAACWYGKDWLISKWKGAEAFAASLEAKANAIKSAVKP
jgi:hypothetical protein